MGENSPYKQNILDAVAVSSLILAYQNLLENREQSAHNDVQAANDKQANYILEELKNQFEEQNQMLRAMLYQLADLNRRLAFLEHERSY